jgi:outer membrane protein insertion porin family
MRELLRHAVLPGIVAFLPLATATPLRSQASDDERESPEVTQVAFTGVHHLDRPLLERSIATKATQCKSILLAPFCLVSRSPLFVQKHYLDRTELKRDVLRIKVLYWRHGYRDTQVDTSVTRAGGGRRVRFTIAEGPPTIVRSIAVEQTTPVLSAKEVRQALRLDEGEPLDLLRLDSSRVRLEDRLWDKGYANALVHDTIVVNEAERAAVVRITVTPRWRAVVASIAVRGNERISRAAIQNMLTLQVGGTYRRTDLIESQRNLYASNLFRRAQIVSADTGDSAKHIEVLVEEAPFHSVSVSGGFNTVDFGQLQARFTNYNWFGGARQLQLSAVVSNLLAPPLNGTGIFQNVTGNLSDTEAAPYLRPNVEAGANITQPWFHDPRNTIGLQVFAHRRSAPAIFIDKGYGAGASFTRSVAARSPLSVVYRYEITEVDAGDVYFCVNYGVCEQATIGALRGRRALSPISLSLLTSRTDDVLDPTTGYQARIDLEHASRVTLSEFRYNRISGEVSRYQPIGRAVLAGRIQFGWVKPLASTGSALGQLGPGGGTILHPRKRFYAGGSQSVRGYGENQLGPRVLTIDPTILEQHGCAAASIADGSCDPSNVPSQEFEPRPTGGTSLIEANLEYRFPIWRQLGGAVFVDGAFVGEGALREITKGTGAITPGFGLRYRSPVGPIRVDLGIRPTLVERLRVITEATAPDGTHRLVELGTPKNYDPLEGSGSGIRQVLSRLTLHLSIGQAF